MNEHTETLLDFIRDCIEPTPAGRLWRYQIRPAWNAWRCDAQLETGLLLHGRLHRSWSPDDVLDALQHLYPGVEPTSRNGQRGWANCELVTVAASPMSVAALTQRYSLSHPTSEEYRRWAQRERDAALATLAYETEHRRPTRKHLFCPTCACAVEHSGSPETFSTTPKASRMTGPDAAPTGDLARLLGT